MLPNTRAAARSTSFALTPLALAGVCALASPARAQEQPPSAALSDPASRTLFSPTPRALMRPMSTDRPDTTESPFTVDAGHLQLEMSFLSFTRDDPDDAPGTDTLTIAPVNFKLGLLNTTDIQFVLDPYVIADPDGEPESQGVGDFTIRLKHNLFGNDGGAAALALMPFVTLPTGADHVSAGHVEGGLIVPLALELPRGFSLGLMGELDLVRNEEGDGYDAEFLHTAAVGRDILGPLGGYAEYIGVAPIDGDGPYAASLSGGLTFELTPDARLDCGAVFGLNDAAEDLTLFAGVSLRY